jgi:hypothetical protein
MSQTRGAGCQPVGVGRDQPAVQAAREPAEVTGGHVRGDGYRVEAAPGELGVHHLRRLGVRARMRQVQVHPGSAGDPGGQR